VRLLYSPEKRQKKEEIQISIKTPEEATRKILVLKRSQRKIEALFNQERSSICYRVLKNFG